MWTIFFALIVGWAIGYCHALYNAVQNLKKGEGKSWQKVTSLPVQDDPD
jgi:hypothetical protein